MWTADLRIFRVCRVRASTVRVTFRVKVRVSVCTSVDLYSSILPWLWPLCGVLEATRMQDIIVDHSPEYDFPCTSAKLRICPQILVEK